MVSLSSWCSREPPQKFGLLSDKKRSPHTWHIVCAQEEASEKEITVPFGRESPLCQEHVHTEARPPGTVPAQGGQLSMPFAVCVSLDFGALHVP